MHVFSFFHKYFRLCLVKSPEAEPAALAHSVTINGISTNFSQSAHPSIHHSGPSLEDPGGGWAGRWSLECQFIQNSSGTFEKQTET